jgi:hypothetical protein
MPDPARVSREPVLKVSRRRAPPERDEHNLDQNHASSHQVGEHRGEKRQWPRQHKATVRIPALQRQTDPMHERPGNEALGAPWMPLHRGVRV